MTIGERIKEVRTRLGISQVSFADKIGVSKQTLYKYENNIITNIPSDKIEAIAKVSGYSPSYLMGWEEPEDENQTGYYLNQDTAQYADFLLHHPEYQVLFDASRKVKPEDIEKALTALGLFSE
ncbi:helix-turn-helix transcriptional regulator [Roseburia sp. NSJ-9]|uniref:Helix-turn-helix transcriptional regulator n=1 Tax=Roseburia lenta TaxID=2763061 RepID=A0ABR7GDT0_9FIRM|nr:helix-turn-helix transcriptional regulator [Roseburia lenta]MBC5685597.1 helix-turn-helix transcriptional regulator [Roseburia lenta]